MSKTLNALRSVERLLIASVGMLAVGCTGGSGDEGTVDMSPQASATAKTGMTKEAEARARRIAEETSGKAR